MRSLLRISLLMSLSLLTWSQQAHAECDPTKILMQDSIALNEVIRSSLNGRKSEEVATNKSTSLDTTYIGWGYGSGSYDSKFADAIKKSFSIDYRSSASTWQSITALSDNARRAYSDCLLATSQNVYIMPDEGTAQDASSIQMKVSVRPYLPSQPEKTLRSTFTSNQERLDKHIGEQELVPGATRSFTLNRDTSKELIFTARVGQEERAFVIPPVSPNTIRRELRYSKSIIKYFNKNSDNHDNGTICIELDADDPSVIIPKTESFVQIKSIQINTDHKMSVNTEYSPKRLCMIGGQSNRAKEMLLDVCGYLTVDVLTSVPRQQAASSKSAKPAYIDNAQACK